MNRRRRQDGNDTMEEESDHLLDSPAPLVRSTTAVMDIRFIRRFYCLHSSVIIFILILGMIHNGGNRKYIPVKPKGLINLLSESSIDIAKFGACDKAFVNVHSLTIDEDLAAICCTGTDKSNKRISTIDDGWYQSHLCHPRLPVVGAPIQQLPFAGRLSRILEAWLVPLLPILFHLIYQLVVPERKKVKTEVHSSQRSVRTTLRRLLFYILLLNLRGFVLYLGANAFEEHVVHQYWMTAGDIENGCWYKETLKAHQKSEDCYGRLFDFSDHVVLFLANYLAIFVAEVLIIYSQPFWDDAATTTTTTTTTGKLQTKQGEPGCLFTICAMFNTIFVFLFAYLHVIVCHALYQTTAYFHTAAEVFVGYVVSLIIQLPVIYFMCTERQELKAFVGLPSSKEHLSIE